jgi:hypothetical protein
VALGRPLLCFVVALSWCGQLPAQENRSDFNLEIDSLPYVHAWSNYTDYGETGHLTHDFGSENIISSSFYYASFDTQRIVRTGDTVQLWNRLYSDTSKFLTVIFDTQNDRIVSLEYHTSAGSWNDRQIAHYCRIEDIPFTQTFSSVQAEFKGAQIGGHSIIDSTWQYQYLQSGDQSFTDTYRTSETVIPSSRIFFSLSKSVIFSDVAFSCSPTTTLTVYPNPATNMLSVAIPRVTLPKEGSIVDAIGRTVLRFSAPSLAQDPTIDISSLSIGIYSLRLGSCSQKFAVSR